MQSLPEVCLEPDITSINVVVCIHDALDDVCRCLASLVLHTDARHRLILVDDGSARPCRDEVFSFARTHSQCTLIRNDQARGYTKAANQGLRASNAELVVLLNSDTIVTPMWLERLAECAASDPKIGVVGPLSNAAGYQSIPLRFDEDGGWALNPLPPGWGPDQVAAVLASIAPRAFPRVTFVNGFCFGIKRVVIDSIGYLDEAGFPDAYGEEDDYCLRAAAAGFELAVADHAYVYHAGSRSYAP
jgi:GT2 family glycosyltransferase